MKLKAYYKPCSPIWPEKRSKPKPAVAALKCNLAAFAEIRVVCIIMHLWLGWFFFATSEARIKPKRHTLATNAL